MKEFKSGAVVLLVSGVVCKVLGALFRLPLTNMLGVEGIGIFQLEMALYSFALVFVCGGATTALSKLISSARASGREDKVLLYLRYALLFSVLFGILVGVVFTLLARVIANFQGITQESSYYLFVIMLPLGSTLAALRGYFQGHENMTPTAVSQVIEQVFRFSFGLLFAYLFCKDGITKGVFGAFVGVTLSEAMALVSLIIFYFVKSGRKRIVYSQSYQREARREFAKANFPLMFSAVILPLVGAFESLVIVPRLISAGFSTEDATVLFGLQSGVVGVLLNFPLIVSIAVTTSILPNLSYQISRGANSKHIIERGLKLLLFLILPLTFGLVAISKPALSLLYTSMSASLIDTAFNLLLFGAFSTIFTAIMQYIVMILEASGKFGFSLLIVLLGGIARAVVSFSLSGIESVNIYALTLGSVAMTAIVCVFGLIKIKRYMPFKIPVSELLIMTLGSLLMFLAVYYFVESSTLASLFKLIIGVAIGVVVYGVITVSVLLKIFNLRKKTITKTVV